MLHSTILNIFAQSPLKPMQKHMDIIKNCAYELGNFFDAVFEGDWNKAQSLHEIIMQKELDADDLKKEIRLHLPTSLFLPVSRGDLLGLLTSQDKIASKAKHLSGLIISRKMEFPKSIIEDYKTFLKVCIEATRYAHKAINEFDELVETGFRGHELTIVEEMINDLDSAEQKTDTMQVELRSKVFAMEKDLDPVNVIFLYKAIDWTAELADRAQHVGHRLETILAT